MNRRLFALALAVTVLTGCDRTDATPPDTQHLQPLPTVDADGSLTVPSGYRPGPKIDIARVDCAHYLEITPVDIRDEARRLCAASATPAERERNPYCEIDAITTACVAQGKAAR